MLNETCCSLNILVSVYIYRQSIGYNGLNKIDN